MLESNAAREVDQAEGVLVVGIEPCVDDRDTHAWDPGVPCPGFGSMDLTHVPLERQEECALRGKDALSRDRHRIVGDISLTILECGHPLHHHIPFNLAVPARELVRRGVGETFYHRYPNLALYSDERPTRCGPVGCEVVRNRIA